MTPHRWELHEPTATCPVRYWHCPGCNGIHSNADPPPVDPCPGKGPYDAESAYGCVRAFQILGIPLPADFWERPGARALRAILDAGVEAA